MALTYRMSELKPGERGVVASVRTTGAMRRRLMDMGLIPGAEIQSLFRGGWGDPTAYLIQGAVVALRRDDAGTILVTV